MSSSDATLVRAASASDEAALAELYRRHAPVAERVARSVTANGDDAYDAVAEAFTRVFGALMSGRVGTIDFRAYLLAATRNAAIDQARRSGRMGPAGDLAALDRAEPGGGPAEQVLAGEDSTLIAQAFRDLPGRWQSVLWLTEVERVPLREAAGVLGLTPNNVAQLAVRARSRLRERYLQSLVHNHARPGCQATVDRLGSLVAGTLTARRRSEVEQHLSACPDCRRRRADVEDLGASLRRTVVPVPAALLALVARLDGNGPAGSRPAPTDHGPPPVAGPPAVAPPPPAAALAPAVPNATATAANPVVSMAAAVAGSPVTQALATSAVATMAPIAAAPPVRQWVAAAAAALVALVPTLGDRSDRPATAAAPPPPAVTVARPPDPQPPAADPPPPPPSQAEVASPPPSPPTPTARPAAATANPHSTVAEALVTAVGVFRSPGAPDPSLVLSNPQPSGAPLVLLVLEQQGDWLHVLLPTRPNGSTGWVRTDDVAVAEHRYSIVIELAAHQLTVFDANQVIHNEVIGVGTARTPTPGGLYYIKELIEPIDASGRPDPDGPYGPYAYGLSGFSDVLDSFGGGDGVIGIHGTNDPSTLGRDVSHGCIRMSNAGITALAEILPLGVPVEIRP